MLKSLFKISFVSLVSALIFWAAIYLISSGNLPGLGVVLIILMLLIDFFILNPKAYPYRYTIPALVLLFILVLYPIYFTIKTAFTNYGTGHMMTRQEAILTLLTDPAYTYTLESSPTVSYAVFSNGEDFLILFKKGGEYYVSLPPSPKVRRGRTVLLREGKAFHPQDIELFPNEENPRYISFSGRMYKKLYDPDDKLTLSSEGTFKVSIAQKYLFRAEIVFPDKSRYALRLA